MSGRGARGGGAAEGVGLTAAARRTRARRSGPGAWPAAPRACRARGCRPPAGWRRAERPVVGFVVGMVYCVVGICVVLLGVLGGGVRLQGGRKGEGEGERAVYAGRQAWEHSGLWWTRRGCSHVNSCARGARAEGVRCTLVLSVGSRRMAATTCSMGVMPVPPAIMPMCETCFSLLPTLKTPWPCELRGRSGAEGRAGKRRRTEGAGACARGQGGACERARVRASASGWCRAVLWRACVCSLAARCAGSPKPTPARPPCVPRPWSSARAALGRHWHRAASADMKLARPAPAPEPDELAAASAARSAQQGAAGSRQQGLRSGLHWRAPAPLPLGPRRRQASARPWPPRGSLRLTLHKPTQAPRPLEERQNRARRERGGELPTGQKRVERTLYSFMPHGPEMVTWSPTLSEARYCDILPPSGKRSSLPLS